MLHNLPINYYSTNYFIINNNLSIYSSTMTNKPFDITLKHVYLHKIVTSYIEPTYKTKQRIYCTQNMLYTTIHIYCSFTE